jgi:hypothetical protein
MTQAEVTMSIGRPEGFGGVSNPSGLQDQTTHPSPRVY